MGLPVTRLGLLSAAVVLLLRGGSAVKANGSLRYYYLEVPEPSQEQPQFSIRSYLDDEPIARFDSRTKKMEPRVPWMKQEEEVKEEEFLFPERVFDDDLKKLSKVDHPTEGFHTWQAILGCELREDGSKGGFFRYGYDGMDFIIFENETLTCVAPQPQADKVKKKLEENPDWSCRNKDYLEKICIECLQRYLSYRKETLEYTVPPVGMVTHKVVNDSLEVLICQAFGFYPKKIQANWTRDGEICQNETLHRNVAPNSNGTYYVRLSIEIDPKERHRFQCHLSHEGLQEPLVLALKKKTATGWQSPVITVTGVLILGAVILFLIYLSVKWRELLGYQKTKPLFEDSPSGILCHPPTSGREEDETLLNSSLESEITLDDKASYEGWSSQRAVEDSGSNVRRREKKQQLLRRYSWSGALDKTGATESEEAIGAQSRERVWKSHPASERERERATNFKQPQGSWLPPPGRLCHQHQGISPPLTSRKEHHQKQQQDNKDGPTWK